MARDRTNLPREVVESPTWTVSKKSLDVAPTDSIGVGMVVLLMVGLDNPEDLL